MHLCLTVSCLSADMLQYRCSESPDNVESIEVAMMNLHQG
jgi:hypothetical protein